MARFIPNTDEKQAYGEGDWRPILSKEVRGKVEGVTIEMIGASSMKDNLSTVILPSHDYYSMDTEDAAFGSSFSPCWTGSIDSHDRRHFAPSAWAIPLVMYPFHGDKKEHWISPSNRETLMGADSFSSDDTADAFADLASYIRRNKELTQDQKDYYLKKPDPRTDALVPNRSVRYFSLGWGSDKTRTSKHLQVLLYTGSAHSYIVEQLRWMHEGEEDPRDPDYPRYLIGDPTNPAYALPFHAQKFRIDPKDNTETNVLCLTHERGFLGDVKPEILTKEILEQRFVLADPANWNFPLYEEQVAYMIGHYDEAVTSEMIKRACGHRCDVGERSMNKVTFLSGQNDPQARQGKTAEPTAVDHIAAITGGAVTQKGFTPDRPAQAEQTAAPKPAKKDVVIQDLYWAGLQGEETKKLTANNLQEIYEAGNLDYKVCVDNVWGPIADCGLFPIDAPKTVPKDDEPPIVPTDDEPPIVPEDSSPEDSTVLFRNQLFDAEDYDSADAARKALIDNWTERAYAATGGDSTKDIPEDLVAEMMAMIEV